MTGRPALRVAVLAGILLLPFLSLLAGSAALIPLFSLPALFIVSGLLYRAEDLPPGLADGEGGGGLGPSPPKAPPGPRRGGVPLPDAEPARTRLRDHSATPGAKAPRRREPCHPPPGPRRNPATRGGD